MTTGWADSTIVYGDFCSIRASFKKNYETGVRIEIRNADGARGATTPYLPGSGGAISHGFPSFPINSHGFPSLFKKIVVLACGYQPQRGAKISEEEDDEEEDREQKQAYPGKSDQIQPFLILATNGHE